MRDQCAPSSHGSGHILQSADEMGTEAAFKSEMTPSELMVSASELMVSASVPMTRAFIFLAVAKTTMSGGVIGMGVYSKRTSIIHESF